MTQQTILYFLTVAVLYAGWAAVLVRIRHWLWPPIPNGMQAAGLPTLDWAELALLANDTQGVFQSAIVWYVQNGYADYDAKALRLIPLHPLPDNVRPAVRMVAHNSHIYELRNRVRPSFSRHFKYLEAQGLLIPLPQRIGRQVIGILQFFASMIPFCCGLYAISLFFDNAATEFGRGNRAILVSLIIACVSGLILLLYSFFLMGAVQLLPGRLTRWGECVLKDHQKQAWPNRRWFEICGPVPNLEENLATAVALFGLPVSKHTPIPHLMEGLCGPNIDL
jgi:uncharacterized protein (TIGR04222 family)